MLPTGQVYVRGIFVEHSHDIFPEYSENVPYEIPGNIPWGMFWEYWMYEYSLNVLWISHECYIYFFRWIKKYISGWGCSWYSLSAFENLIFSWKSNKYLTIANNCLTINYNNNYTILLNSDYVIIESIIMYAFL